VIRVEGLRKQYGRHVALREVTFAVAANEIVGFVGPNGAGKTTTLRVLSGLVDADAGRVLVGGHDVSSARADACRSIGYLPESAPSYADMRVDEFLRFRGRLKGVARKQLASHVDGAIQQTRLGDARRRLIGRLSKGFRQRVGLADALVARPPVLILDEPTAGLDPVQVKQFRDLLRELARDHTVLLSSHALTEVEAVAKRVVVIVAGETVADAAPSELWQVAGVDQGASFEQVFVALAEKHQSVVGDNT